MHSPALTHQMNKLYSSFFTDTNTFDVVDLDAQETALSAYEQAIVLAPREAILYYHKGQVLEQLGRIAEAQIAYETARNLGHRC
ncbi:tetratricopeptide repeat protein [Dictyobacter kobayashii]|uniref:Uncharacterized protein n=1 Tax=Dictyobacter kobayashii TaxID=2014872 RepID=A0A402AFU7_9CHLR|nr:tetratricopeptide repeat protein [Dictyobacter kobayashii]GCE17981.1 hypothetical protein KDK_17810 [Dictyobacter kobayashii]